MPIINSLNDPNLIQLLSSGGLAVLRTDTVYGILASAMHQAAVEKVYQLKGRDQHKALIILVDAPSQIPGLTPELLQQYQLLSAERPTSLIIPKTSQPDWLTRGGDSLAYRVPAAGDLRQLLQATGPLVAPSANPQGLVTASNVDEARDYFGDQVDIYVDSGPVSGQTKPSRIVQIIDGQIRVLRS